jgi:hypothetical protein
MGKSVKRLGGYRVSINCYSCFGNPRYILDLLLSVIRMSLEAMEIVNNLHKLNFKNNAGG